jgi:hypothetical protein
MKITFRKDDRQYSIDCFPGDGNHHPGNPVWLRSENDGDGWGLSKADEKKLYDAIFDAIDDFFNKHM